MKAPEQARAWDGDATPEPPRAPESDAASQQSGQPEQPQSDQPKLPAEPIHRIRICGVPVDVLTMEQSLDAACELIEDGKPSQHVAINAAKVIAARHDAELRDIIENCAINNADGQSVVWASRILGQRADRLPERVTGIDLMLELWRRAAERGYGVYLLGAKPETVLKAAAEARSQGVTIVGTHSGFWKPEDEASIVAEVAATQPDLLFVGLPTPRKERFLAEHLEALGVPLAIGVGGSFDVVAGEVTRAPRWMQRAGMEWLHRMRQEPRRMFRRYFIGNLQFIGLVSRDWVRGRRRAAGRTR